MEGKVKWFDSTKGIGYILTEKGENIYVHYTKIQNFSKIKTLKSNQAVSFDVIKGKRGLQAENVKLLN